MQEFFLEATQYTPEIHLNPNGTFSMKGKSYPENTFEFYKPVMEWIEEYVVNNKSNTITVNMEIIYFNSSSSKLFFDLFDLLDENRNNRKITVNWLYDEENESAMEAGQDFAEDFEELHIELIAKK